MPSAWPPAGPSAGAPPGAARWSWRPPSWSRPARSPECSPRSTTGGPRTRPGPPRCPPRPASRPCPRCRRCPPRRSPSPSPGRLGQGRRARASPLEAGAEKAGSRPRAVDGGLPPPNSQVLVDRAHDGDPRHAVIASRIADRPAAVWFADYAPDTLTARVAAVTSGGAAQGRVPVVVPYAIPGRDCGGHSQGEHPTWTRTTPGSTVSRPGWAPARSSSSWSRTRSPRPSASPPVHARTASPRWPGPAAS
ncbi:hypothetical protein SPURM210S_00121 [Streptomyces purpurascens]